MVEEKMGFRKNQEKRTNSNFIRFCGTEKILSHNKCKLVNLALLEFDVKLSNLLRLVLGFPAGPVTEMLTNQTIVLIS